MWLKVPAAAPPAECGSLAFSRKAIAMSAWRRLNNQDGAHALSGYEVGDLGMRGPDVLLPRIPTQRHASCPDEGDVRNAGKGENANLPHDAPYNY